MSTCKECINWTPHQYIKNHGTCNAEVPVWVDLEVVDNITSKWSGSMCVCFREEQEPDAYDLQRKLDACRSSHQILKEAMDYS